MSGAVRASVQRVCATTRVRQIFMPFAVMQPRARCMGTRLRMADVLGFHQDANALWIDFLGPLGWPAYRQLV